MNILPDFLQPLERLSGPFPREAMEAAITRREESIPHLLHAIEWAEANADEANDADPPYMLHLYALYLLAQFRESRAYEAVVRLARHPAIDELIGDTLSEDLHAILAAVCGGDPGLIEKLIEDDSVDEWVRSAAVRSLGALLRMGIRSQEELSPYLGALFGRLARQPSFVWDSLVAVCVDLRFAEHLDAIRTAYREGLADPTVDRLEDVERTIVLPPDTLVERASRDEYAPLNDAIARMQRWDCFRPKDPHETAAINDDEELDDFDRLESVYESPESVVPDVPKIGRNERCPCGSGKKYKKCCGTVLR